MLYCEILNGGVIYYRIHGGHRSGHCRRHGDGDCDHAAVAALCQTTTRVLPVLWLAVLTSEFLADTHEVQWLTELSQADRQTEKNKITDR